MDNQVYGVSTDKRLIESLRHNCGPLLLGALEDTGIIETMLNPDGTLWVERYGAGQECIGSLPLSQGKMILSLVASALGVVVTDKTPIVEGEFPLDGARFEGAFPPIVGPGVSFTHRKKASKVFTLEEYRAAGSVTTEGIGIITDAVAHRKNIVVVGGTSSGKTTFVNAIIDRISALCPDDRLVILEDTAELQCTSKNKVFLRTSSIPGAEIGLRQLAKVCMRYNPTRILIGEVRDAAALELLKLWNTGHPGGIGTFHADSAEEALERLEEIVEEAGLGSKQKLIGRAVDLIVYMEKTTDGIRRISNMMRVDSFDSATLTYNTEVIYEA